MCKEVETKSKRRGVAGRYREIVPDTITLSFPSFATLLVRSFGDNLADPDAPPLQLGAAGTAFITRMPNGRHALVTAGHVVTCRHSETDQPLGKGGTPTFLAVRLPHADRWDVHYWVRLPLRDPDGVPLWLQHPAGLAVDVVAVPLPPALQFCSEDGLQQAEDRAEFETSWVVRPDIVWSDIGAPLHPISLDVADELSIVGYPFGVTGGAGLAIWTRGFIATELQFGHDGLPMYLVDARTREGQSGAPVVFFSRSGEFPTGHGIAFGLGANLMRFMGVYSGRIHDRSDLGRVFTTAAVVDVLSSGVAPVSSDY